MLSPAGSEKFIVPSPVGMTGIDPSTFPIQKRPRVPFLTMIGFLGIRWFFHLHTKAKAEASHGSLATTRCNPGASSMRV